MRGSSGVNAGSCSEGMDEESVMVWGSDSKSRICRDVENRYGLDEMVSGLAMLLGGGAREYDVS